ncbi:hypothetical protein GCM10009737_19820 [Nocardioides lentus]|uniref:Uncharacterized protein n=1 Tax=Nocardioides lentus TaxID=338077 RepID=A0ABN2PCP1_9ACTN
MSSAPVPPSGAGLGLHRAEDLGALWRELTADVPDGDRGARALLAALGTEGRHARRAYGALGLGVRRALTWEPADRRDPRWWPQGISDPHEPGGDLLLTTWYSKKLDGVSHGSRITALDVRRRRYLHVLLVEPRAGRDGGPPTFRPLQVHAGGLVWWGDWVHVAATARGFATCHLDDLVRVPAAWRERTFGHSWVLPMRVAHRARTADGTDPLRYSFLSLDDHDPAHPALVVGEYGRGRQTRRLVRWPLDPADRLPAVDASGRAEPIEVLDGVPGMQGALRREDRWVVSTSHGPTTPGSLWVRRDADGAWRRRRWATPVGPEDLTVRGGADGAGGDEVWTVTEHPRRRWVVGMRMPRD